MEFRLSENTVNSYDTYCTERDKYKTGANPGGGWVPLKDWLVSEEFKSSWSNNSINGLPSSPTKNGSTELFQAIWSKASGNNGLTGGIIGVHSGSDDRYAGDQDGDGNCAVGITNTYSSAMLGDCPWGDSWFPDYATSITKILLVRPL